MECGGTEFQTDTDESLPARTLALDESTVFA
jgi:hypothetical protein